MFCPEPLRIAVTQRVIEHDAYPERRDALAQEWADCLARWNAVPLLIPNRWSDAAGLVRLWGVDAILLTGGNDPVAAGPDAVDVAPDRDRVENALLAVARADGIPVLGVCRGAQMMQLFLGGELGRNPDHADPPHDHEICWADSVDRPPTSVNSYHAWTIDPDALAPNLRALALAGDGSVEAFAHRQLPWLGLLWHPERPLRQDPSLDRDLSRWLRGERDIFAAEVMS